MKITWKQIVMNTTTRLDDVVSFLSTGWIKLLLYIERSFTADGDMSLMLNCTENSLAFTSNQRTVLVCYSYDSKELCKLLKFVHFMIFNGNLGKSSKLVVCEFFGF